MCTFVFAVLPPESDLEQVRSVAERFGVSLRPVHQEDFHDLPGAVYYTTQQFCDCGTVFGSALRVGNPEADADAQVQKLRNKGWSETKIARWQAEKGRAVERQDEKRHQPARQEIAKWLAFLPAVFDARVTPWLGLFYHTYLRDPKMTVQQTVPIAANSVTAEHLLQMPQDVLYRFLAPR